MTIKARGLGSCRSYKGLSHHGGTIIMGIPALATFIAPGFLVTAAPVVA